MTIHKLEHVGIYVEDMETSVAFYSNVLGMEVKDKVQLSETEQLVFLGFPGSSETLVELVPRRGKALAEVGLVNHLAFSVRDIDLEVERLKAAGVQFMDPQPSVLVNGTRYIFFYGPDREHLELFQPAAH